MSEILTIALVVIVIYFLGKFIISEGERAEQHKKFIKDMEDYDARKNFKTK